MLDFRRSSGYILSTLTSDRERGKCHLSEAPAILANEIRAGPLAHQVEQGTFNPKVPGSSPGRPTRESPREAKEPRPDGRGSFRTHDRPLPNHAIVADSMRRTGGSGQDVIR
jgi:hypothetical protein